MSAHRGFAWILAKRMPADDETLTGNRSNRHNPTDTFIKYLLFIIKFYINCTKIFINLFTMVYK